MNFAEFAELASSDGRWRDVARLPWDDEAFSARMLREHLSQAHDGASRRFEIIDRQVRWIHEHVVGGSASRVLDLGCGPGFYTQRLAALGHNCTAVDIAPASIAYAREHAAGDRERYALGDMATTAVDGSYDLIMLVHGEFNVLPRGDARAVLDRARSTIADDGRLLLEVHHWDAVRAIGQRPRSWSAAANGLFSDAPYLRLDESRWDEATGTAINLHWIFDDATGEVRRYGTQTHAYRDEKYLELLRKAGFSRIEPSPSLEGGAADSNYTVLIAGA